MTRLQQILTVTLVVQVALAVFLFWPRPAAQAGGAPLLPGFAANDVISVAIQSEDGQRIALAKDGDTWIMADADKYPALGDKIIEFLQKIEKVRTNRLVTETEASHKRLKVAPDSFSRLIDLTMKDGATHKLYLGESVGTSDTPVRADDQPKVYLTADLQPFQVDPAATNWVNTVYYTVPETTTVALTLQNPNGAFEFVKEGDKWTMKGLAAGETFAENNLQTILGQVTTMRMTRPIGKQDKPEFGLDKPQATLTLKVLENGQEKSYTLRFGAKNDKDNTYVASWSGSSYYVYVAGFTANDLIGKNHQSFLLLPPTPAPAPGTGATNSQ